MQGKGMFGLVVDKRPTSLARMRKAGEKFAHTAKAYAETGRMPFFTKLRYDFFTFVYRVGNRIMYPLSGQQ